jgi:hypothetical protein
MTTAATPIDMASTEQRGAQRVAGGGVAGEAEGVGGRMPRLRHPGACARSACGGGQVRSEVPARACPFSVLRRLPSSISNCRRRARRGRVVGDDDQRDAGWR